MYCTKSAQALRRLFASYHEPLPLSRQQTQKYLDGLKASFRNQLDREYGQGSNHAGSAPSPANSGSKPRHSAATRHLKSILSNPLFSYSNQPKGLDVLPAAPASNRDPMDVFDHAVARGMMTLKAATGCLVAKRKLLLTSDPHADLGSSEAAKRVVRWLRSSGAESNLAFLDNGPFVRSLAPFLVAERLEQAAWNWITQSINDKPEALDTTVQVRRVSHLLAELVRVKSQPQYGDLNAAITTILDAEQRFHHHPLLPRILVLPWRSVSWLSTVEAYGRTRPQKSLFDAHLATADLLNEPLTIERAHLNLYDPKSPNQAPALQFFNDRTGLRELLARFSPEKAKVAKLKGMTVVPWIAFLGHDTVNHLTRTGQSRQAEEMEELLRTELPDLFNDAAYPV